MLGRTQQSYAAATNAGDSSAASAVTAVTAFSAAAAAFEVASAVAVAGASSVTAVAHSAAGLVTGFPQTADTAALLAVSAAAATVPPATTAGAVAAKRLLRDFLLLAVERGLPGLLPARPLKIQRRGVFLPLPRWAFPGRCCSSCCYSCPATAKSP